MSQITTHVLDTSLGRPAVGVPIHLYQQVENESDNSAEKKWEKMGCGITNSDGRIAKLLDSDLPLPAGVYRVHFDIKRYFATAQQKAFYPYVDVVFELGDGGEHYHIPLLLSPFGYSTYRGS